MIMTDSYNRYTVARGDFMGLHRAMDRPKPQAKTR
jgi:hypothetical protein